MWQPTRVGVLRWVLACNYTVCGKRSEFDLLVELYVDRHSLDGIRQVRNFDFLSVRQINDIILYISVSYFVICYLAPTFAPTILTCRHASRTRPRIAASVSKRAQATHVQYSPCLPLWLSKGAIGLGVGVDVAIGNETLKETP